MFVGDPGDDVVEVGCLADIDLGVVDRTAVSRSEAVGDFSKFLVGLGEAVEAVNFNPRYLGSWHGTISGCGKMLLTMSTGFNDCLCQRQAKASSTACDYEDFATKVEFFEAHGVCGRVRELSADG